MDEKIKQELERLIQEGEAFKLDTDGSTLAAINFQYHYAITNADAQSKYIKWSELTERFLRANYPEESKRFEVAKKDMYTLHGLNKLISILEAIKALPQRIKDENSKKPKSTGTTVNINNHNNQVQNQQQTQQLIQSIFTEAIKDELDDSQLNEIKKLLDDYTRGTKGSKRKLLEKLASFGTNVLAGVVGNILTNPAMIGLL